MPAALQLLHNQNPSFVILNRPPPPPSPWVQLRFTFAVPSYSYSTRYTFTARATNQAGTGAASNATRFTTPKTDL